MLRVLLSVPVAVACTMAFALPSIAVGLVDHGGRFARRAAGAWGRILLVTWGVRVVVAGRENVPAGPAVYAANHGSTLDIPILFGHLPVDFRIIHKRSLYYVPVVGAYLYFGDGHARQGHGEVAGTGLETSMDVILEIDLIKGKTIAWPRLEDKDYIMVVGAARPLMDAFRIAHVELIEWLVSDYGFGKLDAYALLGQVAESSIANVVDPLYTVVAKFPKRFLPK